MAFLNHGSFGACPAPVLEHQRELRDQLERQPVQFLAREIEPRIDAAREALAAFIGAAPSTLGFVPNATSAVNAVLRSFPFETDDELLVTNHGYNACENSARFVTRRAGAEVVVAELPFPIDSDTTVIDAVLERVTTRTRLALLDHVTSPTGLVLPVAQLVDALHERGIEVLVDGAHAPGMVELDLTELDADYYTGNCHKWMCAPKGAAFLWVRPDHQDQVRPTVISHAANSRRTDRSRFLQEFDWVGTDDPTAWLSIPAALEFLGSLLPGGWPALRAANHELVLSGRDRLLGALGIDAPAPDAMLGSLASVPLGGDSGEAPASAFEVDPLQRELLEAHGIEVPVMWWAGGGCRMIRISAQAYNEIGEYERLAAALQT